MGGMSFPLGEILTVPTEDILVQDQTQNYSANLNNIFDTSTLNTPEKEDFSFNGDFEEFFTWNGQGQAAIEDFEQIKDTLTEDNYLANQRISGALKHLMMILDYVHLHQ